LAKLTSGIGWKNLLKINPEVKEKELAGLRTELLSMYSLSPVSFNRLPGAYLDPTNVLHLLLLRMEAKGAWSSLPEGTNGRGVIKIFADGTQVFGRPFTECGFSPIWPQLPDHHSLSHHYMFALVDAKECLELMTEIFHDMSFDAWIVKMRSCLFVLRSCRITIDFVLVFDWWLHVYTLPGMSEPNQCGADDIICFRCPFSGANKTNWHQEGLPELPEMTLGVNALLPSIPMSNRLYDPLHSNPRQLSAIKSCMLAILHQSDHPCTPSILNYLRTECDFSESSGFNPKSCKIFLSNRKFDCISEFMSNEDFIAEETDFQQFWDHFCEDVAQAFEAVKDVHSILYDSNLPGMPGLILSCQKTVLDFLFKYKFPLWPAVHYCIHHQYDDFIHIWPITPYLILNESNEAFHKRLRILAKMCFITDSVTRASGPDPCCNVILTHAGLVFALEEQIGVSHLPSSAIQAE
jgi:hypothetical protein